MAANVVWTVDGKVLTAPSELTAYDFDKDGDTDADDAQLLLDDVTAGAGKLKADVDGDGDTDTHDVSELLKLISAAKVVLPADGSISVHVTFSLIDEEKEFLDAYYTNGAYVEAFLYANPVSAEDGVERVSHSHPVLGFYGNWSDASMFDKGTLSEYWYEKETRNPYLRIPTVLPTCSATWSPSSMPTRTASTTTSATRLPRTTSMCPRATP